MGDDVIRELGARDYQPAGGILRDHVTVGLTGVAPGRRGRYGRGNRGVGCAVERPDHAGLCAAALNRREHREILKVVGSRNEPLMVGRDPIALLSAVAAQVDS